MENNSWQSKEVEEVVMKSDSAVRYSDAEVVRAATEAQRHRLVVLRSDGTIGDAAFQRIEEELDWTEMGWAQITSTEQ